jgi:hypothetical protein
MDSVTEKELMETLVATISQLGWGAALPDLDPNDTVPGMIIGTDEYINCILDNLPEAMFNEEN